MEREIVMELEVTWKRAMRIWWAFTWRNFIGLVFATVTGAITGALVGVSSSLFEIPNKDSTAEAMILGFLIGIFFSVLAMKMTIGKQYGNYRLVLISNHTFDTHTARTEVTTIE